MRSIQVPELRLKPEVRLQLAAKAGSSWLKLSVAY